MELFGQPIYLESTRKGHRQLVQHWSCFSSGEEHITGYRERVQCTLLNFTACYYFPLFSQSRYDVAVEGNKNKENSRWPVGVEILPDVLLVVTCSEVVSAIAVGTVVSPGCVVCTDVCSGCVVCTVVSCGVVVITVVLST